MCARGCEGPAPTDRAAAEHLSACGCGSPAAVLCMCLQGCRQHSPPSLPVPVALLLQDYYDPDNSCINRVLERRKGIPITLALVHMQVLNERRLVHIAAQQGRAALRQWGQPRAPCKTANRGWHAGIQQCSRSGG